MSGSVLDQTREEEEYTWKEGVVRITCNALIGSGEWEVPRHWIFEDA